MIEQGSTGYNIRNIRKRLGYTQKQLAEKCNMYESQIRKYETGKANPKLTTLKKIADALGCSVVNLIGVEMDLSDVQNKFLEIFDENFRKEAIKATTFYEKLNSENLLSSDEHYQKLIYYYEQLNNTGKYALSELLMDFSNLNDEGQLEASKRVSELVHIEAYSKLKLPDSSTPTWKALHLNPNFAAELDDEEEDK